MIHATTRTLALMALFSAPVAAQTLANFEGQWQGEGTLLRGTEPAQRFQCRLRLRLTQPGLGYLSGRCASAQAAQSFTYMLSETRGGALRAEDIAASENDLPDRMQGSATPDLLRLTDGDAGLWELRRDGDTLHFTIAGAEARGEALLVPRE